ncbi:MAG: hypothetical protein ACR2LM_17140 [Pyrinomonadaceae bacterium]
MKKLITLAMVGSLAFFAVACSSSGDSNRNTNTNTNTTTNANGNAATKPSPHKDPPGSTPHSHNDNKSAKP